MDRYAVVGNPIAHSKSPRIHALFAAQTHQTLVYEPLWVAVDQFAPAVDAFRRQGGLGLNVTLPFKLEAFAYAHRVSEPAKRARAVNTLAFDPDGSVFGDNTDGVGFVRDFLVNQGGILAGKAVLVLGAGGAAQGILQPLLDERPAQLFIANRTAPKAIALAEAFGDLGPVAGGGFDDLEGRSFDVVFNATAAGLQGALPPLPKGLVGAHSVCYDLVYGHEPTPFMTWSRAQGVTRVADGLGMLVEQAAAAFALWRGVRPETQPVIAQLRDEMARG
ncbi:MAG: shikimate dehydrogenase [Candidatus Competibacterales bacterium]